MKHLIAALLVAVASVAANASVVASVYVAGGDPFFDDYDVVFGYGSTSLPVIWQQQVA